MQEFKALANHLADEAGKIVKKYYRTSFDVESKGDESPVTIADREVEQRLREIIEQKRPEDGILGEEFGIKEGASGYTWVIDPIDGTKSFVIGRATFGTLIALCKGDVPVLGVIDQPIMKERWIGTNEGTFYSNGHLDAEFLNRPVRVKPCKELKTARIVSTTPAMFNGDRIYERLDRAGKMMAWGGDCYMYGLLALGFVDVCVEASLSPYDFAALVPVVKGAGGMITDWQGNELTLKSEGKVVALGDKALFSQMSEILN